MNSYRHHLLQKLNQVQVFNNLAFIHDIKKVSEQEVKGQEEHNGKVWPQGMQMLKI